MHRSARSPNIWLSIFLRIVIVTYQLNLDLPHITQQQLIRQAFLSRTDHIRAHRITKRISYALAGLPHQRFTVPFELLGIWEHRRLSCVFDRRYLLGFQGNQPPKIEGKEEDG
jgi:hypothetical protein